MNATSNTEVSLGIGAAEAVPYVKGERMADTPPNPFNTPRESRSITVTLRMTPTEHQAVKRVADAEGVELVEVLREGLGLVLEKRAAKKRDRK